VRDKRIGETRLKLWTAKAFYRLLRRLTEIDVPGDAGDFRLIDRRAMDAMTSMREHSRYLRGMSAWVGFDQTGVRYVRDGRYAGRTKYSLRKMVRFALEGIVSFSDAPLRLVLNLGFLVSAFAFVVGIAAIVVKLADVYTVPGWASIVVVLAFLGGVQLTVMGVIGEYVAQIHKEVKRRPLYLVRDLVGVDEGDAPDSVAGSIPLPAEARP
jgi:dolichol-phosphate mannosyltransferase